MQLIRFKTPTLYNPGTSFTDLRDEMDRLFDVAFPALNTARQADFPIDYYQDKDAYYVRAELPGFRREDLNVEVSQDAFTITGHQQSETKADDSVAKAVTQERRVSRAISLPDQVSPDKIVANYENGILTVTLPKREEVKPRQVTIEVK